MPRLCLIASLIFVASWCSAHELSDVDVADIVVLANSVWKGQIVELQQKQLPSKPNDDTEPPTVLVKVVNGAGKTSYLTTVYVDGDWRISDEEWGRIAFVKELRAKFRKSADPQP